ncbi:MAG: redoxin domain-containing protein [Draconibacterium sp.]|nr:redoxin domain-containing protein [Draconibacterium sp.]
MEYAGKKLDFFQYSDPITKDIEFVFSLEFDENGKCNTIVNNRVIKYVFCDFGIYRGMLFLEPNKTLKLQLPPVHEKSFSDSKNPYFSPVGFWFKTENSADLNNQISDFTHQFNRLTNKFFNELYFRQSKEIYDSVVFLLDKEFVDIKSETFSFHKKMNLKMVETEAFRQKPEQFAKLFTGIKPEYWLNLSFIDLFEKTFNDQLSFAAKSVNGEELRVAVNSGDILYLQNFVKFRYNISGEIVELVILKLLHDAFYSNYFSKNTIIKMVEYKLFANSSNKIIQRSAINIVTKFKHLQKGTNAPVICLNNLQGEQICTNKTTDKFKYIIFADTEMIVCKEHLKYLLNIEKRFNKHLEIFVVLRKTEKLAMKKFIAENKIVGVKLIDENNKFIASYKVKSFPQCFLLNEKHEVQFVYTKAPLDGFEQQFGKFLQNELFMRQRNQR